MRRRTRLSESDLHRIISRSVKRVMNEAAALANLSPEDHVKRKFYRAINNAANDAANKTQEYAKGVEQEPIVSDRRLYGPMFSMLIKVISALFAADSVENATSICNQIKSVAEGLIGPGASKFTVGLRK